MTTAERLKLLNEWYEHSTALDAADKDFCELLGIDDLDRCPILKAAWGVHQAYTESVAARIGDTFDWLTWWWYDADRGKGTCEAKASSWEAEKPIRTIRDLCEIIEADLPGGQS